MADTQPARSSICLVRIWMGKYPAYFDCVLRSCGGNPDIHWLIITDSPAPKNAPPNVRFYQTTLPELATRFTQKLGRDFSGLQMNGSSIQLKITFGLVFDDLLAGYDFWGHCDIDVIFGNLRKFLTEDILTNHDKILCRGHLTLYRNTDKVNRAFLLSCPGVPDLWEVLRTNKQVQFDEWGGIYLIFRYNDFRQYHAEFIADIRPPTKWKITRFDTVAPTNYPEQVFYWYKGGIYRAHYNSDRAVVDEEYAYLHFQQRSMPGPAFNPFEQDGFFINSEGFFPYRREPITAADFARYNPERWRPYPELVKHVKQALRRRLGLAPTGSR